MFLFYTISIKELLNHINSKQRNW